MWTDCPRLVIAAPASGSGKSTVATGLMACLAAGHTVQGFKVGPDYIDPMYHTAATGRPSRNLDTWMVPQDQVVATFVRATQQVDMALIEGVMGLYDGYDAASQAGSTAEVAKLLDAPVILVLDVAKMARSAGALALGYRDFDPQLLIAGVICNRVASARHAEYVTQAIEGIGLPVLGCLPADQALAIPERHLGLYTAVERQSEVADFLQSAGRLLRQHVDLAQLERLAQGRKRLAANPAMPAQVSAAPIRLAVARDEAFCFYYEDNLDLLREAGAEICLFSPLHDARLPERISGLYLGGGYPELHAERLAANAPMRVAIREAFAQAMPIYAECGGLMVLTQSLTDLAGRWHEMYGVLPGRSEMVQHLAMGYRQVKALTDTLLLSEGNVTRGHEFHYSRWIDGSGLPHAYEIMPRRSEDACPEGVALGNLLASYVHLHFGAQPELAPRFVQACRRWHTMRDRADSTFDKDTIEP